MQFLAVNGLASSLNAGVRDACSKLFGLELTLTRWG